MPANETETAQPDSQPKTELAAKKPAPEPSAESGQRPSSAIQIDDSKTIATYANFCRVTGTPEELIVDFGLNPQPFGTPSEPIPVTQRVILNFYTAKRLLSALQMSLQRHEAAFGVLETNVQKRVMPSALRAPQRAGV